MDGLDMKAPSFKLWHFLVGNGATADEATELMNGYAAEVIANHERQAEKPTPGTPKKG